MTAYIARRILYLIPVLLVLSFIIFAFVRALPGGPVAALLGERATEEARRDLEERLGLDRPIWEQYAGYMRNVASGDLGTSTRSRRPVLTELGERFPATVELSIAAIIFAVVAGIPLGFVAARRYLSIFDHTSLVVSLIGISFPVFFLALMLKWVFAVQLGWLPSIGRLDVTRITEHPTNFYVLDAIITGDVGALVDAIRHLILPAIALGTIPLAIIARITRAATLDVLGEDYVRTARAKGLASTIISRRHVLRNALLPVVTIIGLQAGLLLTGAVLTETVFSWPGVGSWMLEAIRFRDFAVLQGGVLFFVVLIVFTNLVVDISYAFLNPKIRYR